MKKLGLISGKNLISKPYSTLHSQVLLREAEYIYNSIKESKPFCKRHRGEVGRKILHTSLVTSKVVSVLCSLPSHILLDAMTLSLLFNL